METFVVIGLGNISNRHRRNLKSLFSDCKVYAMAASGRKICDNVADCDAVVNSIKEVIALKPRFVIVASPATFHLEHTLSLIESKIPVLIEKPIAASADDAIQIERVIRKSGGTASVGYCLRQLGSAKVIREFLNTGKLGKVYNVMSEVGQYLPDWRPGKDFRQCVSAKTNLGGGALLELSHEMDYCNWLFGDIDFNFASLNASKELSLEVEDQAILFGHSADGTNVSIHLDFLQKVPRRHCRIVGSSGVIEWDLLDNRVELIRSGSKVNLYSASNLDRNSMYLDMIKRFYSNLDKPELFHKEIGQAVKLIQSIESIKKEFPVIRN